MKLSLVVAIYNIQDYLEDCIKSIVSQNLSDCEVLLIDDGSTDNSSEICKYYAAKIPNVKYLRKENGGVGSARNHGIKKASGKYIWFIDGDDEINTGSIEILINTIEEINSKLIMFYVFHKRLGEEKLRLESKMLNLKNFTTLNFVNAIESFPVAVWSFIFERIFLINNDLFFENRMQYEDDHFMFRVYNTVPHVSSISRVLYTYKARSGSTMKSEITQQKIDSRFKIILLLNSLQSRMLPEILIKNKLFFYVRMYVEMKADYNSLGDLFELMPKQKIFFKDSKGIILEKLIYNFSKKKYLKKVLNDC